METEKTGKELLVKGMIQYIWADLRTMNMTKFKGLMRMLGGYIKMRISR